MGSLVKKLGRSKPKPPYGRLAEAEDTTAVQARRGYVAMYVGEKAKRYEVPIKYLSSPAFQELLMRSQDDDLDTKIDGPITVACTSKMFEQLLNVAKHQ
ncbi:Small auxin-up RNA - like 10 [Theobroma cacao]|nr:Small auxin-up RNA - like 10 [Theobroma cacao]